MNSWQPADSDDADLPSDRSTQRKMSNGSVKALNQLNKAHEKLKQKEEEFAELQLRTERAVDELIRTKTRLSIVSGEIEKLQAKEIDSVITSGLGTGKEEARQLRRKLNARAEKLCGRVDALHIECSSRLQFDKDKSRTEGLQYVLT